MKRLILSVLSLVAGAGLFMASAGTALACCVYGNPPVITEITATPNELWPPNHKMVEILMDVQGTDIEGWYISGVGIGNLGAGEGDPLNDPDYYYDGQYMELRAERSGQAGARVYTCYVTAWNAYGTDSGWVQVTVPHDQSGG